MNSYAHLIHTLYLHVHVNILKKKQHQEVMVYSICLIQFFSLTGRKPQISQRGWERRSLDTTL